MCQEVPHTRVCELCQCLVFKQWCQALSASIHANTRPTSGLAGSRLLLWFQLILLSEHTLDLDRAGRFGGCSKGVSGAYS